MCHLFDMQEENKTNGYTKYLTGGCIGVIVYTLIKWGQRMDTISNRIASQVNDDGLLKINNTSILVKACKQVSFGVEDITFQNVIYPVEEIVRWQVRDRIFSMMCFAS